jgi:hypothetical protein
MKSRPFNLGPNLAGISECFLSGKPVGYQHDQALKTAHSD